MVALLKNYFLELSVDKVEVMCEAYVKTYNANRNIVRYQEESKEDISIVERP